MSKILKVYNGKQVLKLTSSTKAYGLRYQICYKSVNHAMFFVRDDVRDCLSHLLNKQIVANKLYVSNIQITDYSISFVIDATLDFDLKAFVRFTAQYLINQLNKQFPELELKSTAPSGVLSRLWHRPHYVTTLTVDNFKSLDSYLD